MAEIEVLRGVRPELRWTPIVGKHTLDFIERKRNEIEETELERILFESQTILGRCVPPDEVAGTTTGLTIGYVQSGKTLSFTNVIALARDNGYRMVIVLAGTGNNLKAQSENRLLHDLGIESGDRAWAAFANPDPRRGDAQNIEKALSAWDVPGMPEQRKRAVLITVLKNHVRLRQLVSVLRGLCLNQVPTLIVDDEADQASPNTRAASNKKTGASDMSPTYASILQVKGAIPHHTLLQYTATPQANLLIGLADVLSPSFAELVTPGRGYVGGRRFFCETPPLWKVIPAKDMPSAANLISSTPPSLASALRFFLLGAAIHFVRGQGGNRSMMVHPSQHTGPHADYKQWIDATISAWKICFSEPPESSIFRAASEMFHQEYQELMATHPGIPPLEQLSASMKFVMEETRVAQVNSKQEGSRDVRWRDADYWIVVGGQKLDRGFTVEGLTVTYMPRELGIGNADTVQQRARFFGYKKSFEGLCRVFLTPNVKSALTSYVKHEEFVRNGIEKVRGQPLASWKRDFILARAMKATRPNVIGMSVDHIALNPGWLSPGKLHLGNDKTTNLALLGDAIDSWAREFGVADAGSREDFKDRRSSSPRNQLIADVPLPRVMSELLSRISCADFEDASELTAALLVLGDALQRQPELLCDVFVIGEMSPQVRSLTAHGSINQVFSGKSPNVADWDKLNYVGDRALTGGNVTVHLRTFDIQSADQREIVSRDVPWFALYLPDFVANDVVLERS